MKQQEIDLTFRSDIVWPWGLFFSELGEMLSGELPNLNRIKIDQVLGDFLTPLAVANKEADIGFVTPPACVTMARRGVGPYDHKMENLRAIASLPHDDDMVWAVPAESGIYSIKDMKDHPLRLVLPNKAFPVRFAVERILEGYGLSIDILKQSGWQIIEESHCLKIPTLVIDGKADALVHEGRKTPAWVELGRTRKMRYLPVGEEILAALEKDYGYSRSKITKGMFPGIEEDVPCVDFSDWLLFTCDDIPEDLIYLLTRLLVEKKERLFEFHFRNIPPESNIVTVPIDTSQIMKNIGEIPIHKGAKKYYKENGLI